MKLNRIGTKVVAGLVGIFLAAQPAEAAVVEVIVGPNNSNTFGPVDVTITVGDTVRWIWEGFNHNVAYGPAGASDPSVFYSGAPTNPPNQFEVLFDEAFLNLHPVPGDVYVYNCEPHAIAGMVGSVTVEGPSIPTISQWGMLTMTLLMLAAGGVVIRRRAILAVAS